MTLPISWDEQRSDYVIPFERSSLNFVDKLLDHDEVYLHVKFEDHGCENQISRRSFTESLPTFLDF